MTEFEANALVDAFLAAKAAGQEELWRESHPEAPDGPTVLILWLIASRRVFFHTSLNRVLKAVDARCCVRIAIYMAIIAYPKWLAGSNIVAETHRDAPRKAIRAAIAWYRGSPKNYQDNDLIDATWVAGRAAPTIGMSNIAYAAASAASAAYCHDADAADAVRCAANSAINVVYALPDIEYSIKAINAMIAAIVDHYEGRPLEMP